jgi:hypothetical protein
MVKARKDKAKKVAKKILEEVKPSIWDLIQLPGVKLILVSTLIAGGVVGGIGGYNAGLADCEVCEVCEVCEECEICEECEECEPCPPCEEPEYTPAKCNEIGCFAYC